MSPLRNNVTFAGFTAAVLVSASVCLASLWPVTLSAARQESVKLVTTGDKAGGAEAASVYRLAVLLDSANQTAFARLAGAQILAGNPDEALVSLDRAGQGSDVEQLKIRTLIELGRANEAANEATVLTSPGRSDDDVLLAALALALTGRQAESAALAPRVTAPEAAGRIARAAGSELTLAAELHAAGLLKSSSGILMHVAPSYERNLLLARIRYADGRPAALAEATQLLTSAISAHPAGLEARELLVLVYRAGDLPDAATEQEIQLSKLRSGKL